MRSLTRYLFFLLAAASLLAGSCTALLPTAPAPDASPTPQPAPTEPRSKVPTLDPTLAALQLAVYPPEARTGVPELDRIIDAVLAHDYPALKELTAYLETGCSSSGGLGGPPACRDDETEGTVVISVPFLGPEGHHLRKPDYLSWAGPDVLGLLAAYQTSAGTYSDPAYPAGDQGLVFLLSSGFETVTVQIRKGRIVRYDYGIGGISSGDLSKKASRMILPLSFQPRPTAVPWNLFTDPKGRFSFLYPPPLELLPEDQPESWVLRSQIRIEILPPTTSWISCFDQALGDCPGVEDDRTIQVNGREVRQVSGYLGSVGGSIPQVFHSHIFPWRAVSWPSHFTRSLLTARSAIQPGSGPCKA